MVILKSLNKGFSEQKVKLRRSQAVFEQHRQRNTVELSGMSNDISNNIHEETVIRYRKEK